MDQSQRPVQGEPPTSAMPNVMFREIHKNAFLKRHSSDRRTAFPRRNDRVWVVFCVHDDNEAFLEIYPDQKLALTHKPDWFASLADALHVSPSICGHEDEFEFAVTLTSQVVRLAAPSWDIMMEWVDTIRNKLRELKVLSPKENVYSKMPEPRMPLLPTRDPNSPLPLPPQGPSTILPGVEPVHTEPPAMPEASDATRYQRDNPVPSRSGNEVMDRRNIRQLAVPSTNQNDRRQQENVEDEATQQNGTVVESQPCSEVQVSRPRVRLSRAVSVPDSPVPHSLHLVTPPVLPDPNVTVIEVSNTRGSHSASECGFFNFQVSDEVIHIDADIEDVFFTPPVTPKPKVNPIQESSSPGAHYEPVFFPPDAPIPQVSLVSDPVGNHVSSIKVTLASQQEPSTSSCNPVELVEPKASKVKSVSVTVTPGAAAPSPASSASQNGEACGSISVQTQAKLEKVNTSGLIPRVPSKSTKQKCVVKEVHMEQAEALPCSSSAGEPSLVKEVPESRKAVQVADRDRDVVVVPLYSQVKSKHLRNIEAASSNNDISTSLVPSPVPSRRKINDIKVQRSHSEKKPDVLPRTTSAKSNQPNVLGEGSSSAPVLVSAPAPVPVPAPAPVLVPAPAPTRGNTSAEGHKKSGHANRNEAPSEPSNGANQAVKQSVSNHKHTNEAAALSNTPERESSKKDRLAGGSSNNNSDTEPLTASVQPSVGVINVQDIPLIGGHQRRRRRSSSSDAAPASNAPPARGISGADRIRVNMPPVGATPNSSPRNETEQNSHINLVATGASRLTLREQQVLQLRREMAHPGGVRLQLRRKDCVGSIALVDVLGGVWVAGWKQREHPMLYNALHIGDQLMSVSDVVVRSSADAHKLLRSSSSLYIEFIIRRVPFGKVYALHRSSEGQSLGLVQEGNTAEIKDVLPNSVAARQGLSPKTPSCDGLSLTNWYLTEINGRPLNLFFKDNEVRDRLNSVGKEISILVQPHDYIRQIKKQLKSIRGYKDYIVQ